MNIDILTVPYDSGHKDQRMGRGPRHLVEHGIAGHLGRQGHQVQVAQLDVDDEFPTEIKTAFQLCDRIAEHVQRSARQNHVPLVLAGNCNSAVGGVAGLGPEPVGLIWFDGHADFHTPETTTSGFLDGMGLAIATGRCWRALAADIPGFRPLPDAHVIHLGLHDARARERQRLAESQITVLDAAQIHQQGIEHALAPALEKLQAQVQRCYVHLDLDVIDENIATANQYAESNGLLVTQVAQALLMIQEHLVVAGAGVASYDPDYDAEDRVLSIAFDLIERLVPRR